MEKNYNEIRYHLLNVGYTKEAMNYICGWLVGKGYKSVDEPIKYKKGDNTFYDFISYVNRNEDKENLYDSFVSIFRTFGITI